MNLKKIFLPLFLIIAFLQFDACFSMRTRSSNVKEDEFETLADSGCEKLFYSCEKRPYESGFKLRESDRFLLCGHCFDAKKKACMCGSIEDLAAHIYFDHLGKKEKDDDKQTVWEEFYYLKDGFFCCKGCGTEKCSERKPRKYKHYHKACEHVKHRVFKLRYQCTFCGRVYTDVDGLRKHIKKKHMAGGKRVKKKKKIKVYKKIVVTKKMKKKVQKKKGGLRREKKTSSPVSVASTNSVYSEGSGTPESIESLDSLEDESENRGHNYICVRDPIYDWDLPIKKRSRYY